MMNMEHVLFYQPVQGFHPGFAPHRLTMGKVLTNPSELWVFFGEVKCGSVNRIMAKIRGNHICDVSGT